MKTLISTTALALTLAFAAMPAVAADNAACQASWNKMDAEKSGYITSAHKDHKEHMEMMTKAGRNTAAPDRLSSKEYMDACEANVFARGQK